MIGRIDARFKSARVMAYGSASRFKMLSRLVNFRRFYHDPLIKQKVFAYIEENVELPKLDFDYKALEPVISEEIMRFHHLKHHQAYINNYLAVMKLYNAEHTPNTFEKLLDKANFNGGGHINHSILWKSLVPPSQAQEPTGELYKAIIRDFGSIEKLICNIKTITNDFQGSGWAWLGYDMTSNTIALATTTNQEILQMKTGLIPLLGIDLWEHAYYLQYKNNRAGYVEQVMKIFNWQHALDVMVGKQKDAQKIKKNENS